jgi:cell division transport system permease protein
MTVLIGMCLLGLFLALGTYVLSWSSHLQDQLRVKVYFCTTISTPATVCPKDATRAQVLAVGAALNRDKRVELVTHQTKKQNLAQFKHDYPSEFANTISLLPANPMPESYELTTRDAKETPLVGKAICRAHYPGVEPCTAAHHQLGEAGSGGGVTWASSITKRVLTIGKVISLVFLIAVILLVIASTLLIANTIRLSIFSRRREIEVMKLVGATNWFIRGPFMLEGLLCGLCGSFLAVILLFLGKTLVMPTIHLTDGTNDGIHAVSFSLNALVLIVVGLLLGAAGSGLTIRRFLQV